MDDMREIILIQHSSIGTPPGDLHLLSFKDIKTKKIYTYSDIKPEDYNYAMVCYNSKDSKGWKAINFLKSKYKAEDKEPDLTDDEKKELGDKLEALRKSYEQKNKKPY